MVDPTDPSSTPAPGSLMPGELKTRTEEFGDEPADRNVPGKELPAELDGVGITPGLVAAGFLALAGLIGFGWYLGTRSTDERIDAIVSDLNDLSDTNRVYDSFERESPTSLSASNTNGHSWASVGIPFVADTGVATIQGNNPEDIGIAIVTTDWSDATLGATVERASQGTGLVFRYLDIYNYWSLTAAPDFGTWNLTLIVEGELLHSEPIGLVPTEPGTRLSIKLTGPEIAIYVNGAPITTITDPTFELATTSGLIAQAGTEGSFSEFYVVGPSTGNASLPAQQKSSLATETE